MSSTSSDGLASRWTLYFHDPDDGDWTRGSYTAVATMSRASEFWGVNGMLAGAMGKGMWFVMREGVFPLWDDESNVDGGCMSYVVGKRDVEEVWTRVCELLMCECLMANGSDKDEINGASVSPKNDFCIVKIWLRTKRHGSSPESLRVPMTGGMFSANASKKKN